MVAIYALGDPRTGQIRYVGKTIAIGRRIKDHLCDRARSHKRNWLIGLKAVGLRPVVMVLERVGEDCWQEAERFWIGYLRFIGASLTNQDSGGLGGKRLSVETREKLRKYRPSPEARAKISAAQLGRKLSARSIQKRTLKQTGLKRSSATRAKLSAAARNRVISASARRAMSLAAMGRVVSTDTALKISRTLSGRPKTRAHALAVGLAHRGKTLTPEAIAKRTATRYGRPLQPTL